MVLIRRHNEVVESNLRRLLLSGNTDGLLAYLQALPNSDFRTVGYLLANKLLSELSPEAYWDFFLSIVPANPKAFLGTFLKGLPQAMSSSWSAVLAMPRLKEYGQEKASDIDKKKILEALLPLMATPDECMALLGIFGSAEERKRMPYLLRAATPASYYCLFMMLRHYDDNPQLIKLYCGQLIKNADAMSYKVASLLHSYFGIKDISGSFSTTFHPYELGRFELSYDNFCKRIL